MGKIAIGLYCGYRVVLIKKDEEGNKLMCLSELREFPSAPLTCRKKLDDSSRLDVIVITRVPDMLPSLLPSWSG